MLFIDYITRQENEMNRGYMFVFASEYREHFYKSLEDIPKKENTEAWIYPVICSDFNYERAYAESITYENGEWVSTYEFPKSWLNIIRDHKLKENEKVYEPDLSNIIIYDDHVFHCESDLFKWMKGNGSLKVKKLENTNDNNDNNYDNDEDDIPVGVTVVVENDNVISCEVNLSCEVCGSRVHTTDYELIDHDIPELVNDNNDGIESRMDSALGDGKIVELTLEEDPDIPPHQWKVLSRTEM